MKPEKIPVHPLKLWYRSGVVDQRAMTSKSKRNALWAVFVQSVQESGTYSDGGGLNLRVEGSGAKYYFEWVTIDGKRQNLGLGVYPNCREPSDTILRCTTGMFRRHWKRSEGRLRIRSQNWRSSSWC